MFAYDHVHAYTLLAEIYHIAMKNEIWEISASRVACIRVQATRVRDKCKFWREEVVFFLTISLTVELCCLWLPQGTFELLNMMIIVIERIMVVLPPGSFATKHRSRFATKHRSRFATKLFPSHIIEVVSPPNFLPHISLKSFRHHSSIILESHWPFLKAFCSGKTFFFQLWLM